MNRVQMPIVGYVCPSFTKLRAKPSAEPGYGGQEKLSGQILLVLLQPTTPGFFI
jgi:hypothetical protein